jgi:hypothetical protein
MKIVCLSDTHTYGRKVIVPDGDVLVHAGDHTFKGTESETLNALAWLESLPHKHKVIIAGNHDFFFDESFGNGHQFRSWVIHRSQSVETTLSHYPSITYLQDSSTIIDGVKFYGSPWSPYSEDWAFNFPDIDTAGRVARRTWGAIPVDTDVLLTHTPPAGILDFVDNRWGDDERVGDPYLRKAIFSRLTSLKLHVFGNLHESYGTEKVDGSDIQFVNASINTIDYDPFNDPIVIDL